MQSKRARAAVRAETGSTIILDGATITDNGGYGISTDGTCYISAKGADISRNALGGVHVDRPSPKRRSSPQAIPEGSPNIGSSKGSALKTQILAGVAANVFSAMIIGR